MTDSRGVRRGGRVAAGRLEGGEMDEMVGGGGGVAPPGVCD